MEPHIAVPERNFEINIKRQIHQLTNLPFYFYIVSLITV